MIDKVGGESGDEDSETPARLRRPPDDNAIIEGIGGRAPALGWVGFAFADQAERVVMPIAAEPAATA